MISMARICQVPLHDFLCETRDREYNYVVSVEERMRKKNQSEIIRAGRAVQGR